MKPKTASMRRRRSLPGASASSDPYVLICRKADTICRLSDCAASRTDGAPYTASTSLRHGGSARGDLHVKADRSASRSMTWRKLRSEEHTSELQSLMRISYAVFCLKKKK